MAQDQTLEQEIESDLHHAGVKDSGNRAASIMEVIKDHIPKWNDADKATPPDGDFIGAKRYLCKLSDPHRSNGGKPIYRIAYFHNGRFADYPQGATRVTHWMDPDDIKSEE